MKSHETHQAYGVDGPHDPVSERWDGPTGTFWPTLVALHAYSDGTAHENIHVPSAGDGESSACRSIWRWAPKTAQSIAVSLPS